MRYQVERQESGYGFMVIDTTVPGGENCLVDGAITRAEAELKCAEWNAKHERLIEYAPELLAVAKNTASLLETLQPLFVVLDEGAKTDYATGMKQILATIRLVVAKAEGRE